LSNPAADDLRGSGGSIVSKNILERNGRLRWAVRELPKNPVDNGWLFFSEIDDEAYLANPDNLQVVSFTTVATIEPAVIPILHLPIGTELVFVHEDGRVILFDDSTGEPFQFPT
jgi:hypothetical protein